MTEVEARMFLRGMIEGSGPDPTEGLRWTDPCHIATDIFRPAAVNKLSRETIYDTTQTTDAPYHGVSLVEIYLTEPLPEIQHFQGIFSVDDFGIWHTDSVENILRPVARQRVIPWRYVKGLVLHQKT